MEEDRDKVFFLEFITARAKQGFVNNIPLSYLQTTSHDGIQYLFGSLAYCVPLFFLLYFAITVYYQTMALEFIALDRNAGSCSPVLKPVSGSFLGSSTGKWAGSVGFHYTESVYEFEFTSMQISLAEFGATLKNLKETSLIPMGKLASTKPFKHNLLIWMNYRSSFVVEGKKQSMGLVGRPHDVFHRRFLNGGTAAAAGQCLVYPAITFDVSTAVAALVFHAATYSYYCSHIVDESFLDYQAYYDGASFGVNVDVITATTALAINSGLVELEDMEYIGRWYYFSDSIIYAYVDPRYPRMVPVWCVDDGRTLRSGNQCLISYGNYFALPAINHGDPSCRACPPAGEPFWYCNVIDILVGFIVFDKLATDVERSDALFNIMISSTQDELNYVAYAGMMLATDGSNAYSESAPFAFCGNNCSIVAVRFYDQIDTVVSPHYKSVADGACRDTFNFDEFSLLAITPPTPLIEEYYRCRSFQDSAIIAAIGIASGNSYLFSLPVLMLLLPIMFLFMKIRGIKLKDIHYTEVDKDRVSRDLSFQLLKISNNNFEGVEKGGILHQLANELNRINAADKAQPPKGGEYVGTCSYEVHLEGSVLDDGSMRQLELMERPLQGARGEDVVSSRRGQPVNRD